MGLFNNLGPVVRSLVSANRWLRGPKTYRFPWYLTLVSASHASSNPGLGSVVAYHASRNHISETIKIVSKLLKTFFSSAFQKFELFKQVGNKVTFATANKEGDLSVTD